MNYSIPKSGQKVYWNKKSKRVKVKAPECVFEREAILANVKFNEQEKRLDEGEVRIKLDQGKETQVHPAAVFNKVPRALREEYCRSNIPLRASLRFILRDERVYLSAWLRNPHAEHLAHSGEPDDEYVQEIDKELSKVDGQEDSLAQKPFKALEKILDELDDVERQLRSLRHDEHLAIAGLQPRSTGALEDFCRSVILNVFTRLVYKIQQPVKILEQGREDEAGKRTREWMQEVLARGNYVWDLETKRKTAGDKLNCSNKKLQEAQQALAHKEKHLEGLDAQASEAEKVSQKVQETKQKMHKAQQEVQEAEEALEEAKDVGRRVLEKMRAESQGMECPFCKRRFDPSAIDRCPEVGDIHPQDEENMLRWILAQCLCRSCSEPGTPVKPTIESWLEGVNKVLRDVGAIHEEDLSSLLDTSILELRDGETSLRLQSPRIEGVKALLRLKYGVRCSSTHGFAEPTLKDQLSNFPTEVDLAARLLGVKPENQKSEVSGFLGSWDLYWLESGTKESMEDDFDFRDAGTANLKKVDVRVRTNAYVIEDDGGRVKVRRSGEMSWWPAVTSPCSVSDGGSTLKFNVHFCSRATLRARPLQPHKWCRVELRLKSSQGYDYLDGMEHTRWDAEIAWSRREMHFSCGDRGRSRRIQFHRARTLPDAPEGDEGRHTAAKVLAKQSRDLYQRIEHVERSATINKCNVIADLSVTRTTARLWADALADIVKRNFGIAIAPRRSEEANPDAAAEPDAA
ncbi:unnamed protein product [Effrenium voratum]|nr:unnamed protein product [Effrenium voratum]